MKMRCLVGCVNAIWKKINRTWHKFPQKTKNKSWIILQSVDNSYHQLIQISILLPYSLLFTWEPNWEECFLVGQLIGLSTQTGFHIISSHIVQKATGSDLYRVRDRPINGCLLSRPSALFLFNYLLWWGKARRQAGHAHNTVINGAKTKEMGHTSTEERGEGGGGEKREIMYRHGGQKRRKEQRREKKAWNEEGTEGN